MLACVEQVFDTESFRLRHVSKYPAAVLSLGLSGDARTLAVGLADGTLSIRRHMRKRPPGMTERATRYFHCLSKVDTEAYVCETHSIQAASLSSLHRSFFRAEALVSRQSACCHTAQRRSIQVRSGKRRETPEGGTTAHRPGAMIGC